MPEALSSLCRQLFRRFRTSIRNKDEKPYKCLFCTATFRQKHQLDSHKRKLHNAQKLKCTWIGCNAKFNEYPSRHYHIQKFHDATPYHCDQCNRKYKLKRELDHHKRKHQIMRTRKMQEK